jgi:tRNA pseudouridine38-40 synthase
VERIRFKLTIAYDGTAYEGWQVQKTGTGVQQKIEEALARLFPSAPRLHSSSRTDTGVHALGMVAHLDIPRAQFRMPVAKLRLALNAHLPQDIRVVSAERCRADFHARFQARGKQYQYRVWNHPAMNPLWRHQAWHVPQKLNLTPMRAAARLLVGQHDFRSFAATHNYAVEDTVRTLSRCEVKRSGPLLTFIIEGDGFLYKMCRSVVGTLVQIGQGRFAVEEVKQMLAARDRQRAGMSAPAHGLVLCKVFYGKPRPPVLDAPRDHEPANAPSPCPRPSDERGRRAAPGEGTVTPKVDRALGPLSAAPGHAARRGLRARPD